MKPENLAQAIAALKAASAILQKAYWRAVDINSSAAFKAALSLVAQRRAYVMRVLGDLPLEGGLSPTDRTRVDLALSQAEDALRAVDAAASSQSNLADELAIALRQVLDSAGEALGGIGKAVGEGAGGAVGGIVRGLGPVFAAVLVLAIYVNFFRKA